VSGQQVTKLTSTQDDRYQANTNKPTSPFPLHWEQAPYIWQKNKSQWTALALPDKEETTRIPCTEETTHLPSDIVQNSNLMQGRLHVFPLTQCRAIIISLRAKRLYVFP